MGTSIGTSSTVVAPSSMARRQAASADTLWLTCSCFFEDQHSRSRAWSAISASLVATTTRSMPSRLAQRRQCLLVKQASQRFPLLHGQEVLQTLLGVLRALHRQDREDHARIPSSRTTTRASAFRSRSPRMMVLVTTGRMPSASTLRGLLAIHFIQDEDANEIHVELRHFRAADDRSCMLFIMFAAGPFSALAADDRAKSRQRLSRLRCKRFANAGDRENRPDADERVRRAQDDRFCVRDRFQHPGRRRWLRSAPSKRTPVTRSRARRFTK